MSGASGRSRQTPAKPAESAARTASPTRARWRSDERQARGVPPMPAIVPSAARHASDGVVARPDGTSASARFTSDAGNGSAGVATSGCASSAAAARAASSGNAPGARR